jgi:hypothetical protein
MLLLPTATVAPARKMECMKFLIALLIAFAVLVGGLIALLRGRNDPMGSPEVLERAKRRNRELEEEERREDAR